MQLITGRFCDSLASSKEEFAKYADEYDDMLDVKNDVLNPIWNAVSIMVQEQAVRHDEGSMDYRAGRNRCRIRI